MTVLQLLFCHVVKEGIARQTGVRFIKRIVYSYFLDRLTFFELKV